MNDTNTLRRLNWLWKHRHTHDDDKDCCAQIGELRLQVETVADVAQHSQPAQSALGDNTRGNWNSDATTITLPAGIRVGHLMVAFFKANSPADDAHTLTGWTPMFNIGGREGSNQLAISGWYKIADITDVSGLTASFTSTTSSEGWWVCGSMTTPSGVSYTDTPPVAAVSPNNDPPIIFPPFAPAIARVLAVRFAAFGMSAEGYPDGYESWGGHDIGDKLVVGHALVEVIESENPSAFANDGFSIHTATVAILAGGDALFATGDHGHEHDDLAARNLADNHPQYSLTDGTRAFTGTVTGVAPTADLHLATKKYVDDNAGGGAVRGSETITDPATTAVISHGLGITPAPGMIQIQPRNVNHNVQRIAVASETSTQFTVTVDPAPGTSNAMTFGWLYVPAAPVSIPDPPTTNMVLWLEGEDLAATLSDGDPVATWTDKSAAANDGTQATSGNRPVWKASIVNGLGVVRFTGSSVHHLDFPNIFSGATAGEIFIVVKTNNDPPTEANSGLWDFGTAVFSTHFPFTDGTIYESWGTDTRKTSVNPTPSLAAWNIYNVSSASGAWTNRLNAAVLTTTGTNTVGFETAPVLGHSLTTSHTLDGDVAAVIAYSVELTAGDRSDVHDYLSARFGITI